MSQPTHHKDPDYTAGWLFTVWAPEKKSMVLHLVGKMKVEMRKDEEGYFQAVTKNIRHGDLYFYQPDGEQDYPDPASAYQPQGIHGPSAVVDHSAYLWKDNDWKGLPFADLIFYELHVGAFTPEGTFGAIIPLLDDLADTGINAIELMPVAQCPGSRNWGYDGVFPYAVQHTYGGPEGLRQLVDACHQRGIAVFLDVVYNHLGQEGNYLPFFGPYFSEKYHTPWGKALNFDGASSDGVREYIIGNVLHWAEHYHIDGLRLDAIHEIFDRNAVTIWDCLQSRVKEWEQLSGRRLYLIAESDLNSPRVIRSPEMGGYGFEAQWLDDFHHALYVLLDEEGQQHYRDFGRLEQLAKAYTEGFVHSGEYVRFRQRRHGASSAGIAGSRFIIFNQNHDLPGNRPGGERLSVLVDFEKLKLAAAAVLLAPYVPMLFMGEEYGEDNPFYFFSDYGDPKLRDELREGRRQQFAAFEWKEESPDSQDEEVFRRSKLQWNKRNKGWHRLILQWHRQLIRLRKTEPLLKDLSKNNIRTNLLGRSGNSPACPPVQSGLAVYRHSVNGLRQLVCLFNFSGEKLPYVFSDTRPLAATDRSRSDWKKILSSTDAEWLPPPPYSPPPAAAIAGEEVYLAPWSAAVYTLG